MMKRWLWLFTVLLFCYCDDGDLEVKEISFDEVSLNACTSELTTTVFFKIREDESLILVLQNGILQNVEGEVLSNIPTQSEFYYRFFDNDVASSYFCSEIPPASPTVEREIEATGGTLFINTTERDLGDGTFAYDHNFSIENLILTNDNGEQIIDTNFELGMFTTN